ncbi:MAG: dehydrogenase component [Acidobacteriaceae bacterium]|nr:dehydrogenase component [Acidobacteriaceae bacterium]
MAVKVGGKGGVKAAAKEEASTPSFENPLVPHAVLREMYRKIVESRLLGDYAHRLVRGKKSAPALGSTSGQEACRVALTQGLGLGDLVMDSQPGGLTGYLLGAKLKEVLAEILSVKDKKAVSDRKISASRLLPFVEDAETRLFAGLGVAILAKQMQRADGVVIFVEHHEASHKIWRRVLTLAAKQELPVIFMALARSGKAKIKVELSGMADRCGVPGIPVDATDTVALYRVAQESLVRIRVGGGPVLIEGVAFPAARQGKHGGEDHGPATHLAGYLLQRQVVSPEWLSGVDKDFRKQLAAPKAVIRKKLSYRKNAIRQR